ncbi:MAG TPA: serine hydrolase domain-containing protein [Pyrinomonadaceae bacterium]|nr:serine hydrolase domain-containing protein [Pyrinomonadaceae bacterium]
MRGQTRSTDLFFIVILILSSLSAFGQSNEIGWAIDEYLLVRTQLGRFSGAVLVAKDGKIILRKGYGFADAEKRVPYTAETRHEIASVTKMFTSMAALKLRDRGKLRLDDSICKYLDDCPEIWKPITVEHLMRHISGIPDYEEKLDLGSDKYITFMVDPGATARIFEDSKKLPLDFKPGSTFSYSNTGYIVLSYLIQKVSGQPFTEFVRKAVFQPAGMKYSGMFIRLQAPKDVANGYTHGDLGWDKVIGGVPLTAGHLRKIPQLPLTPPAGDAGMYSTVDDLYRWSQLMDGSPLVSTGEAAEVFKQGLGNYGYGWFVDTAFDRRRLWHNGILPGYLSDMIKFPDDKITIILFANVDRSRMNRIRRDISAMVFGLPYDMPITGKVVKLSTDQLTRLEGSYKMPDGAVLSISNEPDYLTAKLEGRYIAGLIPMSLTEFYFPFMDGKATFTLDPHGTAIKVNMHYNGEDHIGERVVKKP